VTTPTSERIANLAASLGTFEGIAWVNAEVEALRLSMTNSAEALSRVELAQIVAALDSLNGGILAMDRITREMLGDRSSGALDCVG
jgi:hypothetical protein